MTRVSGAWLEAAGTQAVFAMLAAAGHEVFTVGGCVRNALLGQPVGDVDFATDAAPGTVTALAEAAGLRAVPTGVEHGTVTVVADGTGYEVTTFRRDLETDGRRAVVAFGGDLAGDAARRDFTMNALYARAEGTVVDPLGGLADLTARRVRFIGEARDRIAEDYLRILRFFRFQAWYGDPAGGPDAEGLAACAELADGLTRLSAERVGAETRKLLAAPDPAPAVAAMAGAGVLARVLPGADPCALPVLVHLEAGVGAAPDWVRRLAVLGGETGGLRLSRAEARRLDLLRTGVAAGEGAAVAAWRHGAATAVDMALLTAALTGAPLPADLPVETARGASAVFPVSARDLMPALEGPALGRRLAELEAAWIASGMRATRAELLG